MSEEGLSPIVKVISGLMFPFITIFSFYVIMHGHLTPGGGFQGGAIGASAVAMLIVAFGARNVEKKAREENFSMFESIGGLVFVIVALLGFILAATFMANFLVGEIIFGKIPQFGSNPGILNSGGVLPILNFAVGMKVIGGLSAIILVMALALRKED
ncbi:MAG: MnhB domain-containing protein [Candidatus Thermoplasmatota archaeon]|nr:MnhB domain-containing protein [Candidatus Thermoplasmatota archaeon]